MHRSRHRHLVVLAVCAGLATLIGPSALAASSSPVVPRAGTVAGHGYGYFLKRTWLNFFRSSHLPSVVCQTEQVSGVRVAVLIGGLKSAVCNEPAGRPIYATQLATGCDSLKGDHKGLNGKHYPGTPAGLEKCARTFKGFGYALSLDGQTIDLDKLVAGTGAFFVPKLAYRGGRPAHAAVYGGGLLLRGLTKGTHTLVRTYSNPHKIITFTIKAT